MFRVPQTPDDGTRKSHAIHRVRAACEPVERRILLCTDHAGLLSGAAPVSLQELLLSGQVRAEFPARTPTDNQAVGGDAVIDWINKGTVANPTDNFDAFGANEGIAREIVQRALDDWMRVIVDFSYGSGGNTYNVVISAATVPNGALGDNLITGIEVSTGLMTSSRIRLSPDIGWYFDPVPGTSLVPDDAEFTGILNPYAANTALPGPDFYSVTLHELGHAMGIFVAVGSAAAIQNYLTNTGIADPFSASDFLFNYNVNGGPIEATLTSRGGGHPLEGSAPPGTLSHPNDLMNSALPNSRRRLISDLDAEILRDAYGMTVVLPSQINNILANLDTSSNDLTLSSDPNTPGDFFRVFRSGGTLIVDVNTYRETFPIGEVDSITINADSGDSQFDIQDLPSFMPMTINAGAGNDSLFIGDGDYDTNILSDVVFFGADGTDSIYVDDVSDGAGNDTYILGVGDFRKISGGTLSFTSSTEQITIDGGLASDTFEIQDVPANLSVTVDGNGGDDTINVGSDIDSDIRGPLFVDGGANNDSLNFNDGLDAASDDSYTFTNTGLTKSSMGGLLVTFSATTIESLFLRANAGPNLITLGSTPTDRSTTIDGAGGDDTVSAGDDFDSDFDGYVSATGGAGEDLLLLDDSGDTGADSYTLYASLGQLTKPSWAQELDFITFEDVSLLANNADNTIHIAAVSFSVSVTVNGAAGNDLFQNGDAASFLDLDNWQGPLSLDGSSGIDTLSVNDSADLSPRAYTMFNTSIDRDGSSTGATYGGFETVNLLANNSDDEITVFSTIHGQVEVNGADGNDTIHVNSTGIVTAMTVFGGNGDDTIDAGGGNISGNIDSNNVTLQGNSGTDRVIFLDASDTPGADLCTLSQFTLSKTARTIGFNTFESLEIDGSLQPSTYDLEFASIPITVTAGGGADLFRVATGDLDAFSAGATLNGSAGNDTITFNDTADTGADTYSLSSTALTKGVGEGAFEGANYSLFESVQLDANNATNTITVTSAVSGTRINAGGGADNLQLGTTVAAVNLVVDGGTGLDDVRVSPDAIGQALVTFEVSQDLANLQIAQQGVVTLTAGGQKFIRTNNMLIGGNGTLNLTDNALIYDYSAINPMGALQGLITSGYNNGAWTGTGIRSSSAAATPNRALGFADATDIGSPAMFVGQPIDATTALVQFTLPGDADLDRNVGIGDFSLMAANFNTPNRWSRGDFNYSGNVNIADFSLQASNFNLSIPGDIPPNRRRSNALVQRIELALLA